MGMTNKYRIQKANKLNSPAFLIFQKPFYFLIQNFK